MLIGQEGVSTLFLKPCPNGEDREPDLGEREEIMAANLGREEQ
jgi:hypothetical protein